MLITIVGGCLTQQGNLPGSALYHQRLLANLAATGIAAQLAVVRYERLATCVAKVRAHEAATPADWLIFHLRTEPLLRLTKLIYRYHAPAGLRARLLLNLPGRRGAARHNPLCDRPADAYPAACPTDYSTPPRHRPAPALNAWLGALIGNRRRALRTVLAVLDALAGHAAAAGTRLLVVGPPTRPASAFENDLARRLDMRAAAWAARTPAVRYVPLRGEQGEAGRAFFGPNGIHVSAAGHERIAELLAPNLTLAGHQSAARRAA